jgi:hypothetical protein
MEISSESINNDVKRLNHWRNKLQPVPGLYQYKDNYMHKKEARLADKDKIVSFDIIYMTYHNQSLFSMAPWGLLATPLR